MTASAAAGGASSTACSSGKKRAAGARFRSGSTTSCERPRPIRLCTRTFAPPTARHARTRSSIVRLFTELSPALRTISMWRACGGPVPRVLAQGVGEREPGRQRARRVAVVTVLGHAAAALDRVPVQEPVRRALQHRAHPRMPIARAAAGSPETARPRRRGRRARRDGPDAARAIRRASARPARSARPACAAASRMRPACSISSALRQFRQRLRHAVGVAVARQPRDQHVLAARVPHARELAPGPRARGEAVQQHRDARGARAVIEHGRVHLLAEQVPFVRVERCENRRRGRSSRVRERDHGEAPLVVLQLFLAQHLAQRLGRARARTPPRRACRCARPRSRRR